ncbi:hypothetical protein [Azospirillum brasilense]|nr:hypothetical protein [Azospirillum brasilense]
MAALVGYASSVAVVIHGLTAVGAGTEQVVSASSCWASPWG